MDVWFWIFVCYISINFLLFISMIFFERRKLSTVISWVTILTVLPILGYFFYIMFGSGLSFRVRRMIARRKLTQVGYDEEIAQYLSENKDFKDQFAEYKGIVQCCWKYGSVLCPANDVKIFCNGEEKLQSLLTDLENAEHSINIEYYIFADDATGKKVMSMLVKKAKEGVKVRLIYDSIGCLHAPRRFFRKLKKAGGEVGEFFPPFAHVRMLNLKLNYRNHKKIVVIDGKIAYTGGINLRDDHMGKKKSVSPWRDTHIRVEGSGVYPLQNTFFNDWRYLKRENFSPKKYVEDGYFPAPKILQNGASMQVVLSGPDTEVQNIKEVFIKLLTNAKKSVLIQTPYFVPDETFMSALRIAISSGVEVTVMLPNKPDHRTVFAVSLSYLKEFVEFGGKAYLYDGFLHSKVMVVDDEILSIGTCNIDNRSFGLNFEDTAILYSKTLNKQYRGCFEEDMLNCRAADIEYFKKKRWINRFGQALMRLFSPIL